MGGGGGRGPLYIYICIHGFFFFFFVIFVRGRGGAKRLRGCLLMFETMRILADEFLCVGDVCVYRKVLASFGGLLLYIEGPYKKLTPLRIDYIYLLVKK